MGGLIVKEVSIELSMTQERLSGLVHTLVKLVMRLTKGEGVHARAE
jgi:hypothetical protein